MKIAIGFERQSAMMVGMSPEAELSTTPPGNPRVHFIWDCTLKTSGLAIAVAVAAFFFVGVPLIVGAMILLHSTSFTNHALAFPVSAAICLAIGGSVIGLVGKLMYRLRRSWNRFRVARLERLLAQPGARDRFPHRFVEFQHYGKMSKSGHLKKRIAQLQPGSVIVVDCPREEARWRKHRSSLAFEPISWEPDEERLAWLLSDMPDPSEDPELSKPESSDSRRQRLRQLIGFGIPIIAAGFWLVWVTTGVISGKWSGWSSLKGCGINILIIVAILVYGAFHVLVIGCKNFLVPGGLVRLENGLLYRTPRLELFTPWNASLVMYAGGGVHVVSDGRVKFIETDEVMVQCLILAWINTARTPTMQELQMLLAPESSTASQPVQPN